MEPSVDLDMVDSRRLHQSPPRFISSLRRIGSLWLGRVSRSFLFYYRLHYGIYYAVTTLNVLLIYVYLRLHWNVYLL